MSLKVTTEDFISRSRAIFSNTFDYFEAVYLGMRKPIYLSCKIHGRFEILPVNHLYGKQGCPLCGSGKRRTTADFITLAKEVHGNLYDYSRSIYRNATTKLVVTCRSHGEFSITPDMHLNFNQGCPACAGSKSEQKISEILKELGITFETQKKFPDLLSDRGAPLRFDFFLPLYQTLIEYDGCWHFRETFFSNAEKFARAKKHDILKEEYAEKNGFRLLRLNKPQAIRLKKDIEDFLLLN